MKAASLNEIRKELRDTDPAKVGEFCMRMAKFKKENKELLTYLLFEAHDESAYVQNVKDEILNLFEDLPKGNVYFIKKSLRKILRFLNRQVKYSSIDVTEIELRIFFCLQMKQAKVPLTTGTVIYNLYHQQVKKINTILNKLPEDLQTDFEPDMRKIA
jgi:hypothetical protein